MANSGHIHFYLCTVSRFTLSYITESLVLRELFIYFILFIFISFSTKVTVIVENTQHKYNTCVVCLPLLSSTVYHFAMLNAAPPQFILYFYQSLHLHFCIISCLTVVGCSLKYKKIIRIFFGLLTVQYGQRIVDRRGEKGNKLFFNISSPCGYYGLTTAAAVYKLK